jgi:hypothetical protein
MDSCAKCGKELGFRDRHDCIISYRNALRQGLFSEYKDKKVCLSCQRDLLDSKGIKYRGLLGQKQGMARINELSSMSPPTHTALDEKVNKAILWQKDEVYVSCMSCQEFFEDTTQTFGARVGHKGFLVITNQRVLFACKLGFMAKDYGITYGANLEDIVSVSPGKFGFNDKLIILDKNNQRKDFINPNIQSLIPTINSAITERKSYLQAEKQKEHVQIILDFSSLKDVMAKGGIVMSTYNCPKCNAMVDIPEGGKIMFCKYCGTPIKPVDIFDRIKSLL